MKPRITLNTFRRMERTEEAMLRAVMPLTSAADPAPTTSEIRPETPRRVWRAGTVVAPLTYTLQEVRK